MMADLVCHISSLVVQCQPDVLDATVRYLNGNPAAEVHATDPQGKVVVVLETSTEQQIVETIRDIEQRQGVLSVALVFHQID